MKQTSPSDVRREYILSVLGSVEKAEQFMETLGFPPSVTWRNISNAKERILYDAAKRQEARNVKGQR